MPFDNNKQKQKEYNHQAYLRRKAQKEQLEQTIFGKQDSLNNLKEEAEKRALEDEPDELRGYREAFQRPIQQPTIPDHVLNPTHIVKPTDNPNFLRGGENRAGMTAICSTCGTPLDSKGRCSKCQPTYESEEVERQAKLQRGISC